MERIKVKVKLREFTYGKPGGGYATVTQVGEVELTPAVQAAIEAGQLEIIEAPEIPENLEEMTFQELKSLAQSLGLDTTGIRKKADLIALILEYQNSQESTEGGEGE